MLHDRQLLDALADVQPTSFQGLVYRATRKGLDALAPSTMGGRWMVPNHEPVLYTSLERNGALAEIAFHWGQLNPQPSKQVVVHSIEVEVRRALPLTVKDLDRLGVDWSTADTGDVRRTQEIGAAAAHLSFDSMIVPSARRDCKNLVVMFTNHGSDQHRLVTKASEIVEWRLWISSN